jgi:hypothetical protein
VLAVGVGGAAEGEEGCGEEGEGAAMSSGVLSWMDVAVGGVFGGAARRYPVLRQP